MPKIAIIGGGIGGLSTAIALRQRGFEAEVFEQAPVLLDLGAAIALWPNAMRTLQQLQIADKVLDSAGVINEIQWLTHDGQTLNSIRIENPNTPAVALHRADLQRILLSSLPSSVVRLGHSFRNARIDTDSTTVTFNDSQSIACHYLIGADGVHSRVRTQIAETQQDRFHGYIVWRGISSSTPGKIPGDTAIELHGRGKRFGIGPVGHGRVGWWAAANAELEEFVAKESIADAHDELLDLFDGWYAPILDLIRSTPTILRTEASDRPANTTWGHSRTTLLGDAIHPTTPNLGQGGCMAIEDSVVLARCFERYGLTEAALRTYEKVRYERTSAITYASRLYGEIGQWENQFATAVRSKVISALPGVLIKQLMKPVFDYDAASVRI
jgi:2-polyprenyl-6-methoxyphenol hydroxylase-like FAD-dependent oxidoreductase